MSGLSVRQSRWNTQGKVQYKLLAPICTIKAPSLVPRSSVHTIPILSPHKGMNANLVTSAGGKVQGWHISCDTVGLVAA